ncbi:MAG TPA: ABC transporter permease [Planctomycetota bacterium]|nr:ABC transporter permease [Planctomycetota bacterium]
MDEIATTQVVVDKPANTRILAKEATREKPQSQVLKKIVSAVLLVAFWLLLWQLAYKLSGKEEYQFTPPLPVLETLWEGLRDGTFINGVAASMARVLYGYGISLVMGIVIGMLLVSSGFFNWAFGPLVLGVQSLPSICWLPVAILAFGLKDRAILFVVIMGSVGSVAIATRDGLNQVPVTYQRVASTFGASLPQRLLWVSIPAALPAFISGLKQGWSFSWRSLLAGELLYSTVGVGKLLTEARDLADYPKLFAMMILVVLISVLVDKVLFSRLEERIRVRWGLGGK